MPHEYNCADEMEKGEEVLGVVFVPHAGTTEMIEPGEQAFDFPAALVTAQGPAVLCFENSVSAMWRDQFNAALLPESAGQRIAVVGSVTDEPLGHLAKETVVERLFDESDLVRRSTCNGYRDRKTRAVCNGHDLGPLAAFRLTNASTPFFALAKVPSTNASLKSIRPRSRRSSASAFTIFSNTPSRTHFWKRR